MQEEMGEAKDWGLQDAVGDSVDDWRQCCALMGQGSARAEESQPRSESSIGLMGPCPSFPSRFPHDFYWFAF